MEKTNEKEKWEKEKAKRKGQNGKRTVGDEWVKKMSL
jgi:hypothetical protein